MYLLLSGLTYKLNSQFIQAEPHSGTMHPLLGLPKAPLRPGAKSLGGPEGLRAGCRDFFGPACSSAAKTQELILRAQSTQMSNLLIRGLYIGVL